MKQMISLALALAMGLSLAACSGKDAKNTEPTSDLAYVQDKGTLVVGITEFEPMDYQDENGNWVGFDADMATLFAESLGVEVEFQLIDWDSKIMELDGKTIDVAWNGMTLTEDVKAAMEATCSMEVKSVPGVKNMLFGGEGIFNTLITGPGRIWLQTMPLSNVAGVLRPYMPTGN